MSLLDAALPDAEALYSQFLRAQDEITDLIGDRVYTVLPAKPEWPLVRLTRVAGAPVVARPLVLDKAILQVEAWGGQKKAAHDLAELVRRATATRVEGTHALGVVAAYEFGSLSYVPDDSYSPSRARYVLDVVLYLRPLTATESVGS